MHLSDTIVEYVVGPMTLSREDGHCFFANLGVTYQRVSGEWRRKVVPSDAFFDNLGCFGYFLTIG